jgi:excisionase family DNA binding protein
MPPQSRHTASNGVGLVGLKELAVLLNLSEHVIRVMVHKKKIPVVKINPRNWRFHPKTVIKKLGIEE